MNHQGRFATTTMITKPSFFFDCFVDAARPSWFAVQD
jgi:hypothetical protein